MINTVLAKYVALFQQISQVVYRYGGRQYHWYTTPSLGFVHTKRKQVRTNPTK